MESKFFQALFGEATLSNARDLPPITRSARMSGSLLPDIRIRGDPLKFSLQS
jgi:hypothetical protein